MELLGTTASGSKIYKNHRAEPYFSFVCTGRKTIEGRLNKGLYALVLPNDRIQVNNNDESQAVTVTVLATRTYASFLDLLTHEPLERVLPDVPTLEAGVAAYRTFYTEEQERKHGVIAIEIELVEASA